MPPNSPKIDHCLRLVLARGFFGGDFLVAAFDRSAGLVAGLVAGFAAFFLAEGFRNAGNRKNGFLAAALDFAALVCFLTVGFLAAGLATSFLFLGNFAAEYRRSATKRPRLLPVPLIRHPIWCLPVFVNLHREHLNVEGVSSG